MRLILLLLLASTSLFSQKNYAFKNGNWYNGKDFTEATWYTSGGKFSKKAPSKIDSVIDLTGKFIVPPMGDAYCSSVAGHPSPDMQLKAYMNDGVFYLQILGNNTQERAKVAPQEGKNNTPDVSFSNGDITCTMGEPFRAAEATAMELTRPDVIAAKKEEIAGSRKGLGDSYWFIDDKAALSANWPKIIAQKPGVISIWVIDANKSGGKPGKGLSPDVAKLVIKKAHKSKLKVFAHVETADDIRLAVSLGADGIANIPGSLWQGLGSLSDYELSDDDLKLMAKKQTAIVPLFSQAQTAGTSNAKVQEFQRNTLQRMFAAGVNVVVGSNDLQRTTRGEVNYWFQLGDLNYEAALKTLCERTPQAIFPHRKLGKIDNKYEASFLVLNDNPLNNLLKLRAIDFKVKNGEFVK